jgi:hypothetical protein
MPYSPINTQGYVAAYAGAIAGMAVSGWITEPDPAKYAPVTIIAGAFAEAFDVAWNNSAQLNELEQAAITSIVQQDFSNRGPGPFEDVVFQNSSNWTVTANACVALVLQSDAFFTSQGITPAPAANGNLSVANIAALIALEGVGVGQLVHVQTLGRAFIAVPAGASALESCVVEPSTGNPLVQWQTVVSTSEQRWQEQTIWYVDAIGGNDENNGLDAANAIRTINEFGRRLGESTAALGANITIYIMSDLTDPTYLTLHRKSLEQSLTIRNGRTPIILASGTLATYTAPSTASNEVTVISITGIADFSALVGKKVNFGAQGVARICAVNPSGLGVGFARITIPKIDSNFSLPPNGVPVIGQTVNIEDLGPDLGAITISFLGICGINPTNPYFRPAVYLKEIQASKSCTLISGSMPRWSASREFRIFDCDVIDLSATGTETAVFTSSLRWFSKFEVEARCTACLFIALTSDDLKTIYPRTLPGGSCMFDCVVEKISIECYEAAINFVNLSVFDVIGSGINIHNGSSVYVNGWLIGKNNTIAGLACLGLSSLVLSSAILAITGITGQVRTPNGAYITSADIPRQWQQGSAEIILNGITGSGQVTIPALPTDIRVLIQRKVAAGGIGTLTYTVVATTITVTSTDITESSTIEIFWTSPSSRVGGITN